MMPIFLATHFIDEEFTIHYRNLVTRNFPGRHTANNIAEMLKDYSKEWKIDIMKNSAIAACCSTTLPIIAEFHLVHMS